MTENGQYGIYFAIWVFSGYSIFIIWITWVRGYITRHGRSHGDGPNYGWAALADASIATDIAREGKSLPWPLVLFWLFVAIIFGFPALAIIGFLLNNG